jgi:hypothetical protein
MLNVKRRNKARNTENQRDLTDLRKESRELEILSSYERPWETHRKGRKIRYTKEENNNVMSRYEKSKIIWKRRNFQWN